MKRTIIITLVTLALASVFSACERNDYQDPRYRSGQNK